MYPLLDTELWIMLGRGGGGFEGGQEGQANATKNWVSGRVSLSYWRLAWEGVFPLSKQKFGMLPQNDAIWCMYRCLRKIYHLTVGSGGGLVINAWPSLINASPPPPPARHSQRFHTKVITLLWNSSVSFWTCTNQLRYYEHHRVALRFLSSYS